MCATRPLCRDIILYCFLMCFIGKTDGWNSWCFQRKVSWCLLIQWKLGFRERIFIFIWIHYKLQKQACPDQMSLCPVSEVHNVFSNRNLLSTSVVLTEINCKISALHRQLWQNNLEWCFSCLILEILLGGFWLLEAAFSELYISGNRKAVGFLGKRKEINTEGGWE